MSNVLLNSIPDILQLVSILDTHGKHFCHTEGNLPPNTLNLLEFYSPQSILSSSSRVFCDIINFITHHNNCSVSPRSSPRLSLPPSLLAAACGNFHFIFRCRDFYLANLNHKCSDVFTWLQTEYSITWLVYGEGPVAQVTEFKFRCLYIIYRYRGLETDYTGADI
jgi:hypothetical protein